MVSHCPRARGAARIEGFAKDKDAEGRVPEIPSKEGLGFTTNVNHN